MKIGLLLIGLSWCSLSTAAIYRCQTDQGLVFQQRPCLHSGEEIQLRPLNTAPMALSPAAQALYEQYQNRPKPKKKKAHKKQKTTDKSCWRKQQKKAELRAKLRSGYAPEESAKLHRQLRQAEDYIHRFCD